MIGEFGFNLPTEIKFGRGMAKDIGYIMKDYGFKKPMIIADKGIVKVGLADQIKGYVEDAGLECIVYDDMLPNPRDTDCDKGAEYALKVGTDVLIAVGGGGPMDTAKAIATVMTNGKTAREWIDVELDVKSAPVICIPTTCGTGSEVTFNSVIIDTETRLKGNIFDPKCAPFIALIDPDMINGLPAHLIASTGIDALTHAIEAYVSIVATPITDAIAICAIGLIKANIVKAAKLRDTDAGDAMMLASSLAGIAFGNADTAAVHCIAECFGGYYDIPHGVTNAIFLADVSEYSIPGNPKKYAEVAKALGVDVTGKTDEEAAKEGVEVIRELCRELEIPKLKSFDVINPDDFEFLANASSNHVCNPSNPIEFSKEEYFEIISKVYNA